MEELLTTREAAQRLDVDQSTVRRLVREGRLSAVLLPKISDKKYQPLRFKKSVIERIVKARSAR